ncbi:MFS transporter [Chloroflexota bacterium]
MPQFLSKKPKIFYGYWIMVAAFLFVFTHAGCVFYVFSLFVTPLQADFGWGRGEIMAAMTIYFLVSGLVSPFVGRVIDRYGVRNIVFIGALVGGLGLILLSQMSELWHFYLGYIISGVATTAFGPVSATAMISNWFEKRRGTALGIMSTGFGVGGFVMAPLVGGWFIPSFGWSVSYVVLALMTWIIVIPLALFVIRTKPADMGLNVDGIEEPEIASETKLWRSTTEGLSLKMAMATSIFWLIAIAFIINGFTTIGTVQNQAPHLEDIGFPMAVVATALGIIGLASAVGKVIFGWLCDRIPPKYACAIGFGLQAIAIIILINVKTTTSLAIIWPYAIILGLSIGSWLPTMSMLTSTSFGLASYGAIYGMIYFSQSIGSATGPLMAGYLYDTMNTYHWAFVIFVALYAVAIPAVLLVRRPKS